MGGAGAIQSTARAASGVEAALQVDSPSALVESMRAHPETAAVQTGAVLGDGQVLVVILVEGIVVCLCGANRGQTVLVDVLLDFYASGYCFSGLFVVREQYVFVGHGQPCNGGVLVLYQIGRSRV